MAQMQRSLKRVRQWWNTHSLTRTCVRNNGNFSWRQEKPNTAVLISGCFCGKISTLVFSPENPLSRILPYCSKLSSQIPNSRESKQWNKVVLFSGIQQVAGFAVFRRHMSNKLWTALLFQIHNWLHCVRKLTSLKGNDGIVFKRGVLSNLWTALRSDCATFREVVVSWNAGPLGWVRDQFFIHKALRKRTI